VVIEPTDRILVTETFSLNDYSSSSIEMVVEQLTKLRAKGYTRVDIGAQVDEYGDPEIRFEVARRRLENDEEYAKRTKEEETYRQRRYREYLRMCKEFGHDPAPFEPN
jgi:hypothetical protein